MIRNILDVNFVFRKCMKKGILLCEFELSTRLKFGCVVVELTWLENRKHETTPQFWKL